MKYIRFFLQAALLLGAVLPAAASDYVIRNVNLIDGTGKPLRQSVTVAIHDGRIKSVLAAAVKADIKDAKVIDGTGKFLIPGLWDMHVHLVDVDEVAIPIFPTYGVTSVRDMGGDIDKIKAWKARISAGDLIGPRIRFCGPMLEGSWDQKPGERTDHWPVPNAEAARSVVDRLANAGVDCIKMRTYASPDAYFALAKEAHLRGLPLTGHAPWGIDPIKSSDAGQKSFEHGFYPWPWDKLSAEEKQAVEDTFRKNGSLVVPTLITWQTFLLPEATIDAVIHDVDGKSDPRLLDVSPALRKNWIGGAADIKKSVGGDQSLPGWNRAMDKVYEQIKEMHDHGVGVMVGTDTGATMVYPGAAVHQELKLLVRKCHFTPMEALLGATIMPAKFFHLENDLGTIEEGKLADMVLLGANPLDDISNIDTVEGVMLNGRWLGPADLRGITASVQKQVQQQYKGSK